MEFTNIKGEASRTYTFPNGHTLTIERAARLCVRPSGTHRIETADGRKFIVPAGWLAIEVVAKEWSL